MASKRNSGQKSRKKTVQSAAQNSSDGYSKRRKKEFSEAKKLFSPNFWKEHWMPLALFFVAGFALYGISINYEYILDDAMVIKENLYVNPNDTDYVIGDSTYVVKNNMEGVEGEVPSFGERLRRIFAYDSFMGYFKTEQKLLEGGRYRPLSIATFAVEWQLLGGLNPQVSHFLNILLYIFTAWLFYRILLGLFPLKEGQNKWFSVAFWGALIFLFHPLHVEAVANIKGRDEIMALLGSLAALWAGMKYSDTRKIGWAVLAGFFLFWGMMAKENAITFVAVIPLTLYLFAKTSASQNGTLTGLLLAAALAFIIVRFKALGYFMDPGKEIKDVMNNPFAEMSGSERLATIFLTLGWYIKLLILPHPLTHDYYPYHVPKVGWGDWRALLSLVLYVGMAVFAFMNLRRHKVLSWCILTFLATISIVSNIVVSVGTFMNERFLFMPSIAFAVLVAWLLASFLPKKIKETPQSFNFISGAILLVLLIGYGIRTVTRIPDWKNRMALNTSALINSPNSARANCFMATALYEDVYKKTNDETLKKELLADMSKYLDRALEINPRYYSAIKMRAGIAGETYLLDQQLDKLFHEFEPLLKTVPYIDYVQQFMEYLGPRVNNDKYGSFCYRMGYEYFFKQRGDLPNAILWLGFGNNAADRIEGSKGDPRLLNAAAEVFEAKGETAAAAQYRERARVANAPYSVSTLPQNSSSVKIENQVPVKKKDN